MAGRTRTYPTNNEWDIMQEEFDNSTYNPQYPDDNASSNACQLDICRLYIRNIPKALNYEGLNTAFSKYGTLTETFLNNDPANRYALVKYETPGEANLAMAKLNNTDPLKLNISVAHKSNARKKREDSFRDSNNRNNAYNVRSHRDDNVSVSSRGRNSRKLEDLPNGEDMDESLPALDDDMDSDAKMLGIQLELQRLQVQEQTMQLKKELLQLEVARKKNFTQSNTPSNRCVLPDGRVVVRNANDRNMESREDGSFAAGAGDSLTLPALQRDASRACVACGTPADSYCAQCKVTPYCSQQCQRRDWAERHRGVCHNLARLNSRSEPTVLTAPEVEIPKTLIAPPLRRPYSPANKRQPLVKDQPPADRIQKKPANNYNRQDGINIANNQPPGRSTNSSTGNRNFGQGDQKPQRHQNQNQKQANNENEESGKKDTKPASQPAQAVIEKAKPPPVQPEKPQESPKKLAVNGPKSPGSINDVTPARKIVPIVPKNYLFEALATGDSVLLSVDADAAECRGKPGFVCLSMHERFSEEYQALCEVYVVDCEADKEDYVPKPGDAFSYFNVEDGGWYRARCLTPSLAALLDAGRLVTLAAGDRLKKLPAKYQHMPEFCCHLKGNVKLGDNLKCTLLSQTADGYKVSLENVETGASMGQADITRWLPTVEYPVPVAVSTPNAGTIAVQAVVPEVPRPGVIHSTAVLLVDAAALDRVVVRPAALASCRKFDAVLQDVVLYGRNATPMKEPPRKNDTVIGKFSDGLHYRALCKRTNVKQNKYLLEYIEYGNIEVVPLENIYACPPNLDLSVVPTEASVVTLQGKTGSALTMPAIEYLEKLKDSNAELLLTIPSGAKTAASGSAVTLTLIKSNECLNTKLERLCTPGWKQLEESGGDVVETSPLMYVDLECLELPASGCALDVLDVSALAAGSVSACQRGLDLAAGLQRLTERMEEYCNSELGKEPYLPKHEELCIARFPPYPQWFRAVLLEQTPGSATARVCYVDYGNVEEVPVGMLRKMMPEFVRGHPALAAHLELKGFPKDVTPDMLTRAVEHMQINEEGRGILQVTRCDKQEGGMYSVEAPGLIKAMLG